VALEGREKKEKAILAVVLDSIEQKWEMFKGIKEANYHFLLSNAAAVKEREDCRMGEGRRRKKAIRGGGRDEGVGIPSNHPCIIGEGEGGKEDTSDTLVFIIFSLICEGRGKKKSTGPS